MNKYRYQIGIKLPSEYWYKYDTCGYLIITLYFLFCTHHLAVVQYNVF